MISHVVRMILPGRCSRRLRHGHVNWRVAECLSQHVVLAFQPGGSIHVGTCCQNLACGYGRLQFTFPRIHLARSAAALIIKRGLQQDAITFDVGNNDGLFVHGFIHRTIGKEIYAA